MDEARKRRAELEIQEASLLPELLPESFNLSERELSPEKLEHLEMSRTVCQAMNYPEINEESARNPSPYFSEEYQGKIPDKWGPLIPPGEVDEDSDPEISIIASLYRTFVESRQFWFFIGMVAGSALCHILSLF